MENVIFITNSANPGSLREFFLPENTIYYDQIVNKNIPQSWYNYSNEFDSFAVSESISKLIEDKGAHSIFITLDLGIDTSKVFTLIHHILLNKSKNKKSIPIFIYSDSPVVDIHRMEDQGLLKNIAFNILSTIEVSNCLNNKQEMQRLINKFNADFDFSLYLDSIHHEKKIDRHQISNEWGAIKLALNAGYEHSEINYDFPKTKYFKYLTQKCPLHHLDDRERSQILGEFGLNHLSSNKINFNSLLTNKRILLIDDNSDKGWSQVLQIIFNSPIISKKNLVEVSEIPKCDYILFDLVFLDLYLPNPLKNNIPDMEYSKTLLRNLKELFPQIPIIVFTASNKSWTLDEVLNIGADSMYVKESPEYSGDIEYTKGNFRSFVQGVSKTLNKYKILRPYWENIQCVIENPNFVNIVEKGNSQFKARIRERLEMFYGLIKNGFEQKKYNQDNFHFSDDVLAFMTLWSILNEISECNFKKTEPRTFAIDSSGNQIINHPNRNFIYYLNISNSIKHYKWVIAGQQETFIEYDYRIKYDKNTGAPVTDTSGYYYKFDFEQKSCFKYENNCFRIDSVSGTKTDYQTTLFYQIAFLIEKKNNLCCCSNKVNFQNSVVKLNDIRNHLYLTHGSEMSSGFYNQTEKAKQLSHTIKPDKDIKELFELIAFLITGIEIQVNL